MNNTTNFTTQVEEGPVLNAAQTIVAGSYLGVMSEWLIMYLNVWAYMLTWTNLKVIYHLLYGMNNYVLIWSDWLSCDPLRGSHDR